MVKFILLTLWMTFVAQSAYALDCSALANSGQVPAECQNGEALCTRELANGTNPLCNPAAPACGTEKSCIKAFPGHQCKNSKESCTTNNDCCSGSCIENADPSKPNVGKTCGPIPDFRKLYFPNQLTCKPQPPSGLAHSNQLINANQYECFANSDCCSGTCVAQNAAIPLSKGLGPSNYNPGYCTEPYVCADNVDMGDDLCGKFQNCKADVQVPNYQASPGLDQVLNNSPLPLVRDNNMCIVATADAALDPINVNVNNLNSNATGVQCTAPMNDEDIAMFVEAEGHILAAEYVLRTSTTNNGHSDKFDFLRDANRIGSTLNEGRSRAQSLYLQVRDKVAVEMQQLIAKPEDDPLGIKMLRLQSKLIFAMALKDEMLADLYGGVKRTNGPHIVTTKLAEGGITIDMSNDDDFKALQQAQTDDNGLLVFTQGGGTSGKANSLGRRIQGHNWGCFKWIDIEKGIFVPCKCRAGIIAFKKDKYCSTDTPSSYSINLNNRSYSMVDALIPNNLRAGNIGSGKTLTMERVSLDLINYAKVGGDYTTYDNTNSVEFPSRDIYRDEQELMAEKEEFHTFETALNKRRLSLTDMASYASAFIHMYGQGKEHKLPGATKAKAMRDLATSMAKAMDFHSAARFLRLRQAQCLENAADAREQLNNNKGKGTKIEDKNGNKLDNGDDQANGFNPDTEKDNTSTSSFNDVTTPGVGAFSDVTFNTNAPSSALTTRKNDAGRADESNLTSGNLAQGNAQSIQSNSALRTLNRDNEKDRKKLESLVGKKGVKRIVSANAQFRNNLLAAKASGNLNKAIASKVSGLKEKSDNKSVSNSAIEGKSSKVKRVGQERPGSTLSLSNNSYGGYADDSSDGDDIKDSAHPSGLNNADVSRIMNGLNNANIQDDETDSLWKKVSKAYFRNAYPRLFRKKKQQKKEEDERFQKVNSN